MESRPLGTSSLHVSAVGMGCNNFGRLGTQSESQEGTTAVVDAALEAGITFFDTADVYGKEFGLSERMLGEALRGRRDGVIVATKFGHTELAPPMAGGAPMGSRAYIREAVEGSLSGSASRRSTSTSSTRPMPRRRSRRRWPPSPSS